VKKKSFLFDIYIVTGCFRKTFRKTLKIRI